MLRTICEYQNEPGQLRPRARTTYVQKPGRVKGAVARVVSISKMTLAAPPCRTSLRFAKASEMYSSDRTVPLGPASRMRAFCMTSWSKYRLFFAMAL